ncbi:MAG TPA: hypothetical protein VLE43_08265, partial [Candidatus Saccharimonadia bacterium]|nr:hypothetical protein [Candidatus Saccharimonadia bacterium]
RSKVLVFLALLASPCWSADRAVGECLTIPVPEGVHIRAKNPHEMYESHELSWYDKATGTARGVIVEDTKQADVSQMRTVLEAMMARLKAHDVQMKVPEGTYSPIEAAPLKRGPWKEALWFTHVEGTPPQSNQEAKPPRWHLNMLLWDGRKMWISSFSSRDKAHFAKWLAMVEGVEFNPNVAEGTRAGTRAGKGQ